MIKKLIDNYLQHYKGLPKSCWIAITLTLLQSIAIGMCYFVSVYFVRDLKFSISTAGIALSLYGAGTVMGGGTAGLIIDKVGAKIVLVSGLLIQGACFLLITQTHQASIIMSLMFILGTSAYAFKTANDVWLLSACSTDSELRRQAVSISRIALNLGLGISGILIGSLDYLGFNPLFYLFGITLLIAACLTFLQSDTNISTTLANSETNSGDRNTRLLYISLFCLFSVGLMIAQLGTTYPLYVTEKFPALGMKAVSILFLLDTFLIVFTQASITKALRNMNLLSLAGTGACMMGFGMYILSVSSLFSIAMFSCLVWTTGEMIFMPAAQLIIYENGDSHKKGRAMGFFQSTYAASSVLGPTLGGMIYHQYGGDSLWYACTALGFFCLAICIVYQKSGLYIASTRTNTAT